ncbi:hypothetical protein ACROYT_G034019 [Oculina patagonica]
MQNVFPARELYNSNPCRDMWDSEQYSQAPMSCSQGSQNSSSEMFSQSKMSQLKGFSSFDVWSQPTNSQQIPEWDGMLCGEMWCSACCGVVRCDVVCVVCDVVDVLDSFISLLKDYTKEVKTAMDSFKDSIDTTLASKAEQVASAASESADLIKKLKDDLLEGFGCLRKDLKETEELKQVIAKQNEKIVEQDSQIKMLQTKLEDHRAREEKSKEKQERYMEREDKLLQKLDEISNRQKSAPQVPLPLNQMPVVSNLSQHQASARLQYPSEGYVPQNPAATSSHPNFAWDRTEGPSSVLLHHMQPPSHPPIENKTVEAFHLNLQAPISTPAAPALDYQYPPQSNLPAAKSAFRIQDDAVVPASVNIQYQAAQSQQAATHPTATIAPMRLIQHQDQQPVCHQEGDIMEPVISQGENAATRPPTEVVSVAERQPQERNSALSSPGVCAPILSKTSWPKQSPIAAVQPQIRVKREDDREKMKVSRSPCAKKARKEDPFDIFVFDLTSSSEEESFDAQKTILTSSKVAPKYPVNTHATRSKKLQNIGADTLPIPEGKNHQQKKALTQSHLLKSGFTVKKDASSLRKRATTSKLEETTGKDDKVRGYSSTPNRPIKASLEKGIPRSKVAQNVFQRPKTSFKRNLVAAKRALSFDASIFDGLDDGENIQQITESIRMHAQRKRAAKML